MNEPQASPLAEGLTSHPCAELSAILRSLFSLVGLVLLRTSGLVVCRNDGVASLREFVVLGVGIPRRRGCLVGQHLRTRGSSSPTS